MRMGVRSGAVVWVAMLLGSGPAMAGMEICERWIQEGHAALQRGDVQTLQALHAAPEGQGCSGRQRQQMDAWVAGELWNQALRRHAQGVRGQELQALLREVLRYGSLWQAHTALADLHMDEQAFADAALHYQFAFDAIQEHGSVETLADISQGVFRKAEAARLAAATQGQYVPTTRRRSGAPGGLGSALARSVGIDRVAIPVHFYFDSVEFTEVGQQTARGLLNDLLVESPPAISLIGHADPIGAAEYNRRLSLRRADALAQYLRAGGFAGQIRTEGRGHDELYRPPHPEIFTIEELHQMHRRVELVRR